MANLGSWHFGAGEGGGVRLAVHLGAWGRGGEGGFGGGGVQGRGVQGRGFGAGGRGVQSTWSGAGGVRGQPDQSKNRRPKTKIWPKYLCHGDFFRRLVAHTLAQQLGLAVESATAPFQFVLSTKANSECLAHVAQALTDMDDTATLLSVDGIGAFDLAP